MKILTDRRIRIPVPGTEGFVPTHIVEVREDPGESLMVQWGIWKPGESEWWDWQARTLVFESVPPEFRHLPFELFISQVVRTQRENYIKDGFGPYPAADFAYTQEAFALIVYSHSDHKPTRVAVQVLPFDPTNGIFVCSRVPGWEHLTPDVPTDRPQS
jgi:hypothetical protein